MKTRLARLAWKFLREDLEMTMILDDMIGPLKLMGMTDEVILDLYEISRTDQYKTFERMLQGHRRYTARRSLATKTTKDEQVMHQARLQGEALAFTKILRLFQKAKRARQYIKEDEK